MWALDSTIGCIEASESQVLDLFRSAPIILNPAPGSKPASTEAYICAIKRKSDTKVFLALVVDNRRIYVYTDKGSPDCGEGHERALQQALGCARSMGFSPEPVELSYSPAMREVVLRNIKVLRAPGSKGVAALKHGVAGAPLLPVTHPVRKTVRGETAAAPTELPVRDTASLPLHPPPVPSSAAPSSAAPLAPAGVATLQAAASPCGDRACDSGADRAIAVSESDNRLQLLAVERDTQRLELQQLSALYQQVLAELAAAKEQCARVTGERDRLAQCERELGEALAARDSLYVKVEELSAGQHSLAAELAAAKEECDRLSSERDRLAQREREMEHELAAREVHCRRIEELSAGQHSIAAELAAERDAQQLQLQQLSALHQEVVAELATAKDACARLTEEGDELKGSVLRGEEASTELTALQTELARLSTRLEESAGKNAELAAENAALSQKAAEGDAEIERLSAACAELLERVEELAVRYAATCAENDAAGRELEGMRAEKEAEISRSKPGEGRASEETDRAQLREEEALLAAERELLLERDPQLPAAEPGSDEVSSWHGVHAADFAAFTDPPLSSADLPSFCVPEAPGDDIAGVAYPAAQAAQPIPAAGPGTRTVEFPPLDLMDDFSSFSSSSFAAGDLPTGRFVLRPDLKAIEYVSPGEVLELHQSINNANLSTDGKGQESCRGYICSLKKGKSLHVFAAIYGTKSGRTSVYVPEAQPGDEQSYSGTVRSAISFAEEVGLMMEPVKGNAAAPQPESLSRCPVLRCVGGN